MIRLIVDSTFGIPEEYINKHNIKMVNLKMILDGEATDEGFEKDWASFYEKMKKSKNFPTTSQPSPQDFMDAIDSVYVEDKDAEIIILTISNALSGTINSATIAANSYEGKKIKAIDSRQATTCGRIMVEEVIEKIEAGASFDEVVKFIEELSPRLKIQFVPESMDALKRGGRVSSVTATIASILKIKPVLCFADGKISVLKKALGLGNAIASMIANIPKKLKKIYVCYIYDKSLIPSILQKIKTALNIEPKAVCLEPVFGVHVGIGSVGIATLSE